MVAVALLHLAQTAAEAAAEAATAAATRDSSTRLRGLAASDPRRIGDIFGAERMQHSPA
jgi:hypothetical protein